MWYLLCSLFLDFYPIIIIIIFLMFILLFSLILLLILCYFITCLDPWMILHT